MSVLTNLFKRKSATVTTAATSAATATVRWTPQYIREICSPLVAEENFMNLFLSLPEVFFPIDFIASRIAKAHFELKKSKDDSVVWCNRRMDKVLARPNCVMSWSEVIYSHFVHKLATGNAFLRAAMAEDTADTERKYRWCDHYWPLPAQDVRVEPPRDRVPLYGVAETADLISGYRVDSLGYGQLRFPAWQIWHDRDGVADLYRGSQYLKSPSRLLAAMKPISNLIAVYEARNVIYVKRGGIGFLVSLKQDETGTAAMTAAEKEDLIAQVNERYGVTDGRAPIGVTDIPLSFIRTNLSISELQPFEETLEDAVKIAGVFGIPSVLVPRKDQGTFSNQSNAEKAAYCGVIIPMARQFCEDLTRFLGLDRDGYYLDMNFSDVDCLQQGLKEAEQVKKLVNDRCAAQFDRGLITLNDWRAQMHESQLDEEEMPIFSKLKFQMTPEELDEIKRVQGSTATTRNETDNQTEYDNGTSQTPIIPNESD
ncbi:MAG: phage portal protein [Bacteroidales bacterium]|nr:phage portal protein [Bacteroidales bacterium]